MYMHRCMYLHVLVVGREGNLWQVELKERSGPLQVTRPAWILQINSGDLHFLKLNKTCIRKDRIRN